MSRSYHERVEVRLGEPDLAGVQLEPGWSRGAPGGQGEEQVPTAFLWRGRLMVVRAVVARWTQRVPWWRASEGVSVTAPAEGWAVSGEGLERQVWRVEAARGRSWASGVYELSQHGADGWHLDRVCD